MCDQTGSQQQTGSRGLKALGSQFPRHCGTVLHASTLLLGVGLKMHQGVKWPPLDMLLLSKEAP